MEVIILAGGLGTRLQSVINNIPKPMADINGKPFLEYMLQYLDSFSISTVILSVGYKENIIKDYFGNKYKNINIKYSSEETPLGTGGAIKRALTLVEKENVLVLNGDTFIDIDLREFINTYKEKTFHISIGLNKMYNFDRYGAVSILKNKIVNFEEKQFKKEGFINSGIYIINKHIFDKINIERFSFEDFLQKNIDNLNIYPFICNNSYFIDIGIPSDYERCKLDFKEMF